MKKEIATFIVNGLSYEELIESNMTLSELLRDKLGLTGTKQGCAASGNCGACTVLLDGQPILSCLTLASRVKGRRITTIEGVESEHGELDEMQVAFVSEGAVQCGFCTPAMVLNAKAFMEGNLSADEAQIRNAISGVLCRCTGYQKIVDAVRTVVEEKIGRDDETVMQVKSGSKRGPMS